MGSPCREESVCEITALQIKPAEINLVNCFFYGFETHEEAIAANAIVRVYQARGTWDGSVTESEVAARFSWLIKNFYLSSLVGKGYLLQSGEAYFPTRKFIETCYNAAP